MIQLLFSLVVGEVVVVVLLLVKSPLRKVLVFGLDRVKRGKGPLMVRTVAGTVLVVLVSSGYSIVKIQERSTVENGTVLTPTDQVLMSKHLLEASLMGYSLFLLVIIDRIHHFIREIRRMKKNVEATAKQNKTLEEAKGGSEEIKAKDRLIATLNAKIAQLESLDRSPEDVKKES